jgi:hypothetical protein
VCSGNGSVCVSSQLLQLLLPVDAPHTDSTVRAEWTPRAEMFSDIVGKLDITSVDKSGCAFLECSLISYRGRTHGPCWSTRSSTWVYMGLHNVELRRSTAAECVSTRSGWAELAAYCRCHLWRLPSSLPARPASLDGTRYALTFLLPYVPYSSLGELQY